MKEEKQQLCNVTRSIISPRSLKELISQNYTVTDCRNISLVSVGDNDHYIVSTSNEDFVLRVYQKNKPWIQSKSNLLFEMDWLTFLRKKQISVSYPIKRKDKEFLGELEAPEGTRYWALFSAAPGVPMSLTNNNCYQYGASISKIHLISNSFETNNIRRNLDQEFLINQPIEEIKRHAKGPDRSYILNLANKINIEIGDFSQSVRSDEWGVIGGDFHGENHFSTSKGHMTFFDFDLCGYGWRAYDISVFFRSLFITCNKGKHKKRFNSLWDSFIKGYTSQRPLTKNELSMVHTFALARQIWLMGLYDATYPEITLNKQYLSEMIEFLKKLNTHSSSW